MRRFGMLLLSLLLVFTLVLPASAAEQMQVKVLYNGAELEFDVQPFAENGRTLVPIRLLSEAMGFEVGWDDETQHVTLAKDGLTIKLQIGSSEVTVIDAEGNETKATLDVPAKTVEGRTMVPLRFVAETLETYVAWNGETQTASVTTGAALMDQVTKAQANPSNQKATIELTMHLMVHIPGMPVPMPAESMTMTMSMHTYGNHMLMSMTPGGELEGMGTLLTAIKDGKYYGQNPETGDWEYIMDVDFTDLSEALALTGLEGFNPMALQTEMMSKANVRIVEVVNAEGKQLVRLAVDLKDLDLTEMMNAILAQLGLPTDEEMPEMTVAMTIDSMNMVYLIDPLSHFVYETQVEYDMTMSMTMEGETMTIGLSMMADMAAEPTSEPIQWPAGLLGGGDE